MVIPDYRPIDDVLNVRLSTRVPRKSKLVFHAVVAEAPVVGFPHTIKGDAIYVYVAGVAPSTEITQGLREQVRKVLGPVATPDLIQ